MFFYYAFPMFIAVAAVVLGRLCRWRTGRFFGWWSAIAIALGIGGLFIPWRGASGFHYGWGSPVPLVVWERSGGSYADFPVPAAPFVNPIAVFMLGALCWFTALSTRRFLFRDARVDA
jgi:hypothetical protein